MATYYGTSSDDRLIGTNAADSFFASAGNDTIIGGVYSYEPIDTLSYAGWNGSITVTLPAFSNTDQNSGTVAKSGAEPGTDSFTHIGHLIGTSFADSFTGLAASGYSFAFATPIYVTSGPGNDTIDGAGSAYTVADYSDAATVTVDLAGGFARTPDGLDTLINVRAASGSPGNDTLLGTSRSDDLSGGGGDDLLDGRGGGGLYIGGPGNDTGVFAAPLSQLTFRSDSRFGGSFISSPLDGSYQVGIDRLIAGGVTYGKGVGVTGVSTVSYYITNPDVARAGVDAEAHYFSVGWLEGRNPNGSFSTNAYLQANPDVRAAGINPLTHYLEAGWREGRDPNLMFDTEGYMAKYPDARATGVSPFLGYLQDGAAGLFPQAIGPTAGKNGFDAQYYLFTYGDVAAAGVDPETHFRTIGYTEGRSPSAYFSTTGYLNAYQDVRAAGVDPLAHYMEIGWREGRDPAFVFNTSNYLADNPDVALADVNPLLHYLSFGHAEGRVVNTDYAFDPI